jgi:hypothetical protein
LQGGKFNEDTLTLRSLLRPLAAGIGVVLLIAIAGQARVVVPEGAVPAPAHEVLDEIADAFLAGDHRALAELVHPDGVRLGLGPDPERISELAAAQAFYYFKALFQDLDTQQFEYLRRQEAAGDRIIAVATWRSTRHGGGGLDMRRLLVTLAHHGDGWRITEMTALRGG